MTNGSKAALRGFSHERKFVELVNKNAHFNSSLKAYLGSPAAQLTAEEVRDTSRKADVILHLGGRQYGCSIKTSEADFSQLDRRWLADLSDKLNMPLNIKQKLGECILNKMRNKKDKFILDEHETDIIRYFKANMRPVLTELFTRGEESLEYFVACFFVNEEWYITRIEYVINHISGAELYTTGRGILMFGDCLSMQRKGGNGEHVRFPKTDPRHPGNHLQFKIRPLTLIKALPRNQIFKIDG